MTVISCILVGHGMLWPKGWCCGGEQVCVVCGPIFFGNCPETGKTPFRELQTARSRQTNAAFPSIGVATAPIDLA